MHMEDPSEKSWVQERIEGKEKEISFTPEGKKAMLNRVLEAEGFEKYLHTKYVGTKRFGLDGCESLIPAMEQIIKLGGSLGVKEVKIGMPHRGRLNILTNVIQKPLKKIFKEFAGEPGPADIGVSGDVKYHLGASADREFDGNSVHVSLTANPSHLEAVNPVVLGQTRAKQFFHKDIKRDKVIPILLHGDAAFAGQGVVAECFAMSGVPGHNIGGTIHIIVNNQIGFTTTPSFARSSPYPSEVAKMVQAPIFHVNGDDVEAVVYVTKVATEYRQKFKRDVVIDIFCYRRFGHNEGDEPSFTQPLMYQKIKKHPVPRLIYADQLIAEGSFSEQEIKALADEYRNGLDDGNCVVSEIQPETSHSSDWAKYVGHDWDVDYDASVSVEKLKELGEKVASYPEEYKAQSRVKKIYDDRKLMATGEKPLDWGMAETLAYATIATEGTDIRMTGQDSGRGTFFHRHAVVHSQKDGATYLPLQHLSEDQGAFQVFDSVLSEEAVVAFEYGYATAEPTSLVLWEAQFGDFANGAQVVFDQFLSSGEQKWGRLCGLTILLPHGYEGQGPEHSSARLERFLQLCADHNMQVCVPSTPAQVYAMLRRQSVRPLRRPLIVMTPKSLLRHPLAVSSLEELSNGVFHNMIDEVDDIKPENVERVVFCSGKVYYELLQERRKLEQNNIAIVRVEQLYPFPHDEMKTIMERYQHVTDFVWCQEEPQNQGAWYCSQHHFVDAIPQGAKLKYAGRKASASPACGYMSVHTKEQQALVADALTIENKG